jgi:hypothetical protein
MFLQRFLLRDHRVKEEKEMRNLQNLGCQKKMNCVYVHLA